MLWTVAPLSPAIQSAHSGCITQGLVTWSPRAHVPGSINQPQLTYGSSLITALAPYTRLEMLIVVSITAGHRLLRHGSASTYGMRGLKLDIWQLM